MSVDLNRKVTSWTSGQLKSGAHGLSLIVAVCERMVESGDWSPAARLLKGMAHSEMDQRRIKFIIGQLVENVTMKEDGGDYVFKSKGSTWSARMSNKAGLVGEYITRGESFRSGKLYEALKGEKKETTFDAEKYAKSVLKRLDAEGLDVADFIAKLRAAE